jgi:hypothetical protein
VEQWHWCIGKVKVSVNPISPNCKSDHLFLLVGTNPLPNYVASQLLAAPNTRLYLAVTDEILKMKIPERLLKLLGRDPSDQSQNVPVEASNSIDIYSKVMNRVINTPGSWGLHYTGGKKVMAVHAYRAVERALAETNRAGQGVFSYLDADSLAIVIEQAGKPVEYYSSRLEEPVMLWQLIDLHGKPEATVNKARWDYYPEEAFDNRPLREKLHRTPFQPDLCEALKNASLSDNKVFIDTVIERIPALASETNQRSKDIEDWISNGFWLEHYLLNRILHLKDVCGISDYALGFESHIFDPIDWEKDIFESDVVAIQNYRLFYFSATTSKNKKSNKLRLFEAYARAQQLGGEQAKTALVTFYPEPDRLRRELYDERHIQVSIFGPEHMEDTDTFDEYLKDWMKWSV